MKKKGLVWLLTLAMLASLLVLPAGAAGKTFPDAQGHWAESSIQRWSDCGLVNGDEVGNVNPNKYLRRCELAKMLADMLGLRAAAPISTFRDIRGDEWYANAVLRCAAAGIMEGSFSNCYPEDPVTREEAIVMFSRALGVQPSGDPDLSQFSDSDRVSDWAAPYLATLLDLGILSGMGDDILAPKASMNRAGAFTLMDKAISVYANAPGSYVASDPDRFVVVNAALHDGGEVKITGQAAGVLVATGASNEITLQDLTTSKVLVNGKSSVTATGASKLGLVEMNGAAALTVDSKAAVTGLTVNTDKAAVTNRGTIATLTCAEAATVTNSGTVEKLVAEDAATVTNTGKIETLVANAALRVDNKKGTIQQAEINQSGVILDGTPRQMVLADGVTRPTSSTGRPVTVAGGSSGGSSSGGGGRPSTPTPGVKLDKTTAAIYQGETLKLAATVTMPSSSGEGNVEHTVTWASNKEGVATVAADGTVTAVAPGEATITVTLTVTTTVEPKPENPGTENPGTENPGTEGPGTEGPGTESPDNPEQEGGEDQPAAQADEPITKEEIFTDTCKVTVKPKHTVTVQNSTGGTVTADKTTDVLGGEKVTLTVTPSAQDGAAMPYIVQSVTVNDGTTDTVLTANGEGKYTFQTATDAAKTYTVTAQFVQPILSGELFIAQDEATLNKLVETYGYPENDVTAESLANYPYLVLGLKHNLDAGLTHDVQKSGFKLTIRPTEGTETVNTTMWGGKLGKYSTCYIGTHPDYDPNEPWDELRLDLTREMTFVLTFTYQGAAYSFTCTYTPPAAE